VNRQSWGYPLFFCILFTGLIGAIECGKKVEPSREGKAVSEIGIKVINGTGVRRLAWTIAWDMVNKGFNVFGTGDINQSYQKTVVVDLKDKEGNNARTVALALGTERRFLGIFPKEKLIPAIEVKIDSSCYVDVLLILGEDYSCFFPSVRPIY